MKEYYCINLKFKDERISTKIFHSHLFVSDEEIYFQVIDNERSLQLDKIFLTPDSTDILEKVFEIIDPEVSLFFDKSKIYKIISFQNDSENTYFTIYVSSVGLVFPNAHKEFINEGAAYLNKNGLKVVNSFYSYFKNSKDKNIFSISRMQGMTDIYKMNQFSYRPELEFTNNEKRGSSEFTIRKIPIIKYQFDNMKYEQIKSSIDIVCNFLSLCFGIRIYPNKIVYRTEKDIFIYRDNSPNNKTYISDFSMVFRLLKNNYNIQKILKTEWHKQYLLKKSQLDKAIDNYLNSREVNLSASFLLLFNIIEIFNEKQSLENFEFNDTKIDNFDQAFKLISKSLKNQEDFEMLKNKWIGIANKLELKPMKSPLENTLTINNINPLDYGYSFSKLKNTRDKLTHGSLNSIKENNLKLQNYCLRKITLSLILANLGFKDYLKKNAT